MKEFKDCIDTSFSHYYAIARSGSAITAREFVLHCNRIGAPVKIANNNVKNQFDLHRVEEVFQVEEYAFNADALKQYILSQLSKFSQQIDLKTQTTINRILNTPDGLVLEMQNQSEQFDQIYIATYSSANDLLLNSSLPILQLDFELTEIALVETPEHFKDFAFTIMCGPFFSLMPFPPRNCHSLSHVRYTPHLEWRHESNGRANRAPENLNMKSQFVKMRADARRFIPALNQLRYLSSLFEVKTLLPRSKIDDGRPILFRTNHGRSGLHILVGGKIDNWYDILDCLEAVERK